MYLPTISCRERVSSSDVFRRLTSTPYHNSARFPYSVNVTHCFQTFDTNRAERNWSLNASTLHESITTVSDANSGIQFDWFQYWWPVQLISNLHEDRPNHIELLDRDFVVWRGTHGDWIVMNDKCPHPHWSVNKFSSGVNVKRMESQGVTCGDPSVSVQCFPSKAVANMLWIWPEASSDAFEHSNAQPIPVPTEFDAALRRKFASGVRIGYTRVMPYSLETLIENLIDPSHVPVTHHGLIPGMSRNDAKPLWMESRSVRFAQSIAAATYKSGDGNSERFVELMSPCSIINGEMTDGLESWRGHLICGSPIRSGRSRVFFFNFPMGLEEKNRNFAFMIFGFVQRYFPWLMHLGNHAFLDGDAVFLNQQEKNLRARMSPWSPMTYYTPTSADLMILKFRNWLRESAGNGPKLERGLKNGGQLPDATRRELLDRYYTHTIECEDCKNGKKLILNLSRICTVGVVTCLASVGILLSKKSSSIFSVRFATCVFVLLLCLLMRSFLQQNLIPQFQFVDYVHPEKN